MKSHTCVLDFLKILFVIVLDLPLIRMDNNLMKGLLCKESFLNCGALDLSTDRLICEIRSDRDETYLMRPSGLSHSTVSVSKCPDGTISKTCFPERHKLGYLCFCHSICLDIQQSPETTWTPWSDLNSRYDGFPFWRKLTFTADDALNPIVAEYSNKVYENEYKYVVSAYNLTGSVYSASSKAGTNDVHAAYRAHIDFIGAACSWAASPGENINWLQITLPTKYVIAGVYLEQRCDDPSQYPTRIRVVRSEDGHAWVDVVEDAAVPSSIYTADGQGFATVWFEQEYRGRYWRIYILQFVVHPSMKSDLIGYYLNI